MNVYVFKTSVKKQDLKLLKPTLSRLLVNLEWNFDFEDCDNILRIESRIDVSIMIHSCLNEFGFECLELI
jgi:hypothetical protein